MPVGVVVTMMLQVVGLLIICAVVVVAWGMLGFCGWLGVVLYLVGDAFTPEPPDDDTSRKRGT